MEKDLCMKYITSTLYPNELDYFDGIYDNAVQKLII